MNKMELMSKLRKEMILAIKMQKDWMCKRTRFFASLL